MTARIAVLIALPFFTMSATCATRAAEDGAGASSSAPIPSVVTVDDDAAEFAGAWTGSAKQPPLVGKGYRRDDGAHDGRSTARFVLTIPTAGEYELRLLYPVTPRSTSAARVTVIAADEEKTLNVDQRKDARAAGTIGVLKFAAGEEAVVTVSNAGADGFVIVDGVEAVPVELAQAQRAAAVADPPAARGAVAGASAAARSPAPREPVQLAKAAAAAECDGKTYDLIVVGGTPGGVACAVRAAREGLDVLLVQHTQHIGGMLTNALFQWDAVYGGPRAPIFNETAHAIEEHYRRTYGEKSRQYAVARYTQSHYPMSKFEPSVAEREFNRLVAAEKRITLLLGHYPSAAERDGAILKSIKLRDMKGAGEITVRAAAFADATYEGDLAALAKVPYRVGRESREEYGESHAGKVFTNLAHAAGSSDAIAGKLNLRPYGHTQGTIDPTSPFTADGAIQAFNYRFCLSSDPNNRRLPEKPPGYNREEYVNYNRKGMGGGTLNGKGTFNSPILPGENHRYPEADWAERDKIIERHKNFALGLMYFLQNDESVPQAKRNAYREVGLPLDEFTDHDNIPYEMYVREARRIVGRHVFTQQDNMLAPGLGRTPIFTDSIAFTDWPMDSHDCTTDRRPGFDYDGKVILTEESRPAQVPYRALLPQGVDNLLVPVCLSATHVAWGAIRLEPVWMQTGEAAGFAAALAKQKGVTPASLDADELVRTLVTNGAWVSFHNEMAATANEPFTPALQYFATKGFFHDYNARPADPLTARVAAAWADGFRKLRAGRLDARAVATAVAEAERAAGDHPAMTPAAFAALVADDKLAPEGDANGAPLTRGEALRRLFARLAS